MPPGGGVPIELSEGDRDHDRKQFAATRAALPLEKDSAAGSSAAMCDGKMQHNRECLRQN